MSPPLTMPGGAIMRMGSRASSWLLAGATLSLLSFCSSPISTPPQARNDDRPVPGTVQYARDVGPQLLAAEKWDAAREAYAPWYYEVEKGVAAAWDSHADRSEAERNRFHYHLTNFLVL